MTTPEPHVLDGGIDGVFLAISLGFWADGTSHRTEAQDQEQPRGWQPKQGNGFRDGCANWRLFSEAECGGTRAGTRSLFSTSDRIVLNSGVSLATCVSGRPSTRCPRSVVSVSILRCTTRW